MIATRRVGTRHRTIARNALALLAALCLVLAVVLAARWTDSRNRIRLVANATVAGQVDDQGRVLALLELVWRRTVITLEPFDARAVATLDPRGRRLARLYATLPFNLVPAADVLEYGLAFGGPCGAKSRLLVALLRSQGYTARLTGLSTPDFTPLHTLVEVRLADGWAPLDPTYNVYFERADGSLATTSEVAADPALFRRGVGRSPGYPRDVYTYDNVSQLSVFYVVQRCLRALGLATNEGAPELYSQLAAVVPPAVLRFDLGIPSVYDRPELLGATTLLAVSVAFAWLAWKTHGGGPRKVRVETGSEPGAG